MLRPTANAVKAKENYLLEVTFDNGEVKTFDVKPYQRLLVWTIKGCELFRCSFNGRSYRCVAGWIGFQWVLRD